jgi:signal transduction histidine kinase
MRKPELRRRWASLGMVETVFAIVIAGAELWVTDARLSWPAFLVAALMVGLVAITPRLPFVASVLSLLLLTSAYVLGDVAPLFAFLFAALVLEIIVARGLLTVGIFLAIAQWALSMVDLSNNVLVTDPMSLMMVALLLVVAYIIGWNRNNQGVRQQMLRDSLANQERDQRMELARELHDSVATSLTSVVMRAQALSLLTPDEADQATREGLEGISSTSRDALDQLRTMLRLLNEEPSNTAFRTRGDGPPLRKMISNAAKEMKAHGFKVVTDIDLPRDVSRAANRPPSPEEHTVPGPWFDRATVSKVLTEMASNAVKHSTSRSTVTLTCAVEGTCLVLSMSNEVGEQSLAYDDSAMSSGLGLGSMQARADKAEGVLLSGLENVPDKGSDGQASRESYPLLWRTTLRLPIVVEEP